MATAKAPRFSKRQLMAKITQDQRPEFEQAIVGGFVNLAQVTIPTPLKTDRKVKFYLVKVRGRITTPAGGAAYRAGPPLLGTPLFSLIQQFSIFGEHITYGSQIPFVMPGELQAEMLALFYPNYSPLFSNSVNGGPLIRGQALSGAPNATNDFEFVLRIPTFPCGAAEADQVFYGIHGPDWAGNLYITLTFADCTALGGTAAQVPTAFALGTGTPTVEIMSERPLLGKDLMVAIKPALTFRLFDRQQLTGLLSAGAVGANQKLRDLTVGKDTARILTKVGTSLAGTSAGVVTFGTLSDAIITRTFPSLDDHALTSIIQANSDLALQDYMSMMYGRQVPAGYKIIDFVTGSGPGAPNLPAAYPSATLGAARKFQLTGDVITVAANQIGEVVQEMILGAPDFNNS
jgi:hypothetical protein